MNISHIMDFKVYLIADSEGKEYLAVSTETSRHSPLAIPYTQTVSPTADIQRVEAHLISDINYLRRLVAPSTEDSPLCKHLAPQTQG